jgi:3-oxoacyl-(acyl-carrier-protein) synthase
MRRVVITGIGIYSCIGKNISEVKDSLYNGRSGIGISEERLEYGYRSPLTGIVERPVLKGILGRRERTCLPEEGEYAYMATAEALKTAGLDISYFENNEAGIFYGNDSTAKSVIEANDIAREKKIPHL